MSVALELTRCPVCDAADVREIAGADDLTAEAEELWAFHTRRLRADTPAERLADRVAFSQRRPYRLVQCVECTLVYRNPRERDFELEKTYESEIIGEDVLQSLFETQRASYEAQAARLTDVAGRAGSGLEIGSYVGGFLAAARKHGWNFQGRDVNERANAFARKQGMEVACGTLEDLETRHRYRSVCIWNCLDQLPEPRRAVRLAAALLERGGVLAIRVPNGAFYAALRPALKRFMAPVARTLLAHNNLLTFPYRTGFTVRSLRRLLEDSGLVVVRTFGDSLVPIADQWTRRWARIEERGLKQLLRVPGAAGDAGAALSPWFEMYALRPGRGQS
ncbi:MAG: class I SAM-dependent methyltransferase [Anaerolineae bacterium]|nr:class I SAM-dependent methyltransferase [Gemmatimonadaceae bacterium]